MGTIDRINEPALALRKVIQEFNCYPGDVPSPQVLSKNTPYYGYVEINVSGSPPFLMFSNNDDFVAQSFFWRGKDAYEPLSLRLWASFAKESPCVLDVGAYTGVYALVAAKVNPKLKCFAFEALDRVYTRLLINKKVNQLGNLSVINAAACNIDGELNFNVYSGDEILVTGSSLVERNTGRPIYERKSVRGIQIDRYLNDVNAPRTRLMKIDAEGAEHLVIQGAMETIRSNRPAILCELLSGAQTAQIEAMLAGLGYRYFKIDDAESRLTEVPTLGTATGRGDLNYLLTTTDLPAFDV